MNTVNGLFKEISSKENILLAIHNAAKGKNHKHAVKEAKKNSSEIAEMLSEQLRAGIWRPCEIHKIKVINDGITLKKREIVCPQFVKEQVIHHAVMQVLKPVFMKKFYRYSCASIPNRGVEYALSYIKKAVKDYKNTKYFALIDIKQFFNSIRPSKVFHQLRRMIRDKKTLMILVYILRANKVKIGNEIKKRGTPIGFYTSPWFANVLLTPLDYIIKEDIKYYVRYNDNMLLFSSNKRKLRKTIQRIILYLQKIGLQVKAPPQIHCFNKVKINYIGATISRDKVVLKPNVFLRAKRAANRISKKNTITIYDAQRMISYAGRFRHYNVYKAYMKYIESKVRHKVCRKIISERSKRYVDKVELKRKAIRSTESGS